MSLHIPSNLTKYKNLIVLIEDLFIDYGVTWRFLRACLCSYKVDGINTKFYQSNYTEFEDEIEYLGVIYKEYKTSNSDDEDPNVTELIPLFERIDENKIVEKLKLYLGGNKIRSGDAKYKYTNLIFNNCEVKVYAHKLKSNSTLYNSLRAEGFKVTEIKIPIDCDIKLAETIARIIEDTDSEYYINHIANEDLLKFADILNFLGISFYR